MKILLKLVRAVTELVLWFAVSAIAALSVSWITDGFFGWGYLLGTLLLCFVLFLVATLLARHQRRITWKHLGITAALVAPVALYLGWDEPPSATPLHVELLAPPPPWAAESHAVALWSPQGSHEPEPKRWTPVALGYIWHQLQPTEWRVFVVANRDAIRGEWETCAAARDWIVRLDAFEVIGDLTTTSEAPNIKGVTFRDTCFLYSAYASLLAIEGRGDEALAALRPMLSASRKLKPAARTPIRYAWGIVCQGMSQNAVRFVIQTTPPSKEALRQIAAVLAPGDDVAAANRRVLLCECALGFHQFATANVWVRSYVGAPLWLFFNPNATDNFAARCYRGLVNVAVEGRGEGYRAHEEAARRDLNYRAFKNVVGRWLVSEGIPKLDRIMVRSITVEDERRALLAEVQRRLAFTEGATPTPARPALPAAPPPAK